MTPVPLLRPREVIRALENMGSRVVRLRGSHVMLSKPGHIAALSVPAHALLALGTLRSLIAEAGSSVEEFLRAARD